jgi:DNA repair exonuclease SbcCD ATPase subunit
MHIQSVHVEEFGTIDALEVDLTEGLNVISGPNEAGKSTLMQAVWFALTRRSTSKAQEIRDIVPEEGGTPRVEVSLSVDGTTYQLEKVFDGQSGTASLRAEGADGRIENHSGEEADEVIREALGFGEASGRTGVPEHFGFWPAVWVRQEERQMDPGKHLTDEGDPESVSSVLAQIGGDVLAGSGADIVEQAKKEYDKFYTGSGKPTTRSGAPLNEAKKARDDAKERLEELKEKRESYETDLDRHDRLQSEIGQIEEQLPELEEEAEEAIEEFEQVEELQEKLESAETKLQVAESEVGVWRIA